MTEIDPDCSDNWLKRKFLQKIRSDIRTRLDVDINLPMREIVRKAQNIESNIEQQKIDEKLKLAANQEKPNIPSLLTNNISVNSNNRLQPLPSNTTYSPSFRYNNEAISPSSNVLNHNISSNYRNNSNNEYTNDYSTHFNNNSNQKNFSYQFTDQNRSNRNNHTNRRNNYDADIHRNTFRRDSHHNYICSNKRHPQTASKIQNDSDVFILQHQLPSTNSVSTNRLLTNKTTRRWCPFCQRHGHSWERCPYNPESIYFRSSASAQHPSSTTSNSSTSSLSPSSTFHHNNSHSKNYRGR